MLLNEVAYEQRRMTRAIVDMLKRLSEVRPLMICDKQIPDGVKELY